MSRLRTIVMWSSTLAGTISQAEGKVGLGDGSDYYLNWASALEQILERKNLADDLSLVSVKAEWEQDYTPCKACFSKPPISKPQKFAVTICCFLRSKTGPDQLWHHGFKR